METKLVYPIQWSEKYAICILYHLVAYADATIKKEEMEMVKRKMDRLFEGDQLTPEEKEKIASDVTQYVIGLSDANKKEAIKYFSEKIHLSHEMFIQTMKDLEDIAQSDDYVSIEEHSLMYYIRLKFKRNYVRAMDYDIFSLGQTELMSA